MTPTRATGASVHGPAVKIMQEREWSHHHVIWRGNGVMTRRSCLSSSLERTLARPVASVGRSQPSPLCSLLFQVIFRLSNFHFLVQKCFVERHDNFPNQFTRFANSFWANFQFCVGSAMAGGCGKRSGVRKQNFKITSPG